VFFFFSSRRRHTRSLRDWSSDVCSSDFASRVPDEIGMRGKVIAEISDAAGAQIIDRPAHVGEVFLADRDARGVEDIAVSLLALAQAAKHRQARQRVGEPVTDGLDQTLLLRCPDPGGLALA